MQPYGDFLYSITGERSPCSLDLLCTLLESSDRPAFVVVHHDRTIAWANSAIQHTFGYAPRDLIGRTTATVHVSERAYAEFGERSRPAVEAGQPFRERFWMQRKDDTRFASEHLVTPVKDIAGRQLAISLVTDISEPWERKFDPRLQRLSARERDVLQLTAAGLSVQEIAERLEISPRTVEVHRANLLAKFEVSSTQKLLAELLAASVVQRAQI